MVAEAHAERHLLAEARRQRIKHAREIRLQFGARLLDRHTRLQPSERAQCPTTSFVRFIERLRQQHINARQRGHQEILRQNSGDDGRYAIERNGPTLHLRVKTEAAAPQRVRDHRHARSVGPILLGSERTARGRRQPKRRHEIRLGAHALKPQRMVLCEIARNRSGLEGRHRLERSRMTPQFEVPIGQQELVEVERRHDPDRRQPHFLAIRQRTE
jgi:hypothetical protein